MLFFLDLEYNWFYNEIYEWLFIKGEGMQDYDKLSEFLKCLLIILDL